MAVYNYIGKPIIVSERTLQLTPVTFNRSGYFEPTSIEYFYSLVEKSSVQPINIIDIGAQSGLYTLYAKWLPNCHFYSYEPNPETFSLLVENIKLNSINNVTLINKGLGENVTTLTLKVPIRPDEKGLCCFGENPKRFSNYQSFNVDVDTLDNQFFDKNIPVHFIKADTEGWEYFVLKGGENTLRKWKPELFIEVNDTNLLQCNVSKNSLLEFLNSLGYTLQHIVDGENHHFSAYNSSI